MALPTILVDSATGSDTQASGAGPATALFGSNGVSAGDGLSVDLSTDAPDLSGVATDGSAVLFFNDATAGNKNFVKITNVNNSTKVVTVANALGASLTKAWAIGGKRASIGATTSKKLFENNSAAGDAQAGWIIEMQSGHTETIAAVLNIRCVGDETSGPIILRGTPGAGTLPIVTFSNNGVAIQANGSASGFELRDFELRNSNATKSASVAVGLSIANQSGLRGMKIAHSTDKFWKAVNVTTAGHHIIDCEIGYTTSVGIDQTGVGLLLVNCFIHDCSAAGLFLSSTGQGLRAINCIFYANAASGISLASTTAIGGANANPIVILNCIFDSHTNSGIEASSTSAQTHEYQNLFIANSIFSNNTAYGINFAGSGITAALLNQRSVMLLNNNHYNNASDTSHLSNLTGIEREENTLNINPAYTNAAGGDFRSTALKGKGYPLGGTLAIGTYSSTYSYPDIGMQVDPASGGVPMSRVFTGF